MSNLPAGMKPWLAGCALLLAGTPGAAFAADSYLLFGHQDKLPTGLDEVVASAGGHLLRVHDEIGMAVVLADDPGFGDEMRATGRWATVTRDRVFRSSRADRLQVLGTFRVDPAAQSLSDGGIPDPTSADLYACQEWYLSQIDAQGAWAQGAAGDPDVKVAILDTGIDLMHQDLVGKVDVAQSRSMLTPGTSPCNPGLPDEESPQDFSFIGTMHASQIAGNNIGMASLAPKARLVAIKVENCDMESRFSDIVAGILYAASLHDVDIIDISPNFYLDRDSPEDRPIIRAFRLAVLYATLRGKLVVAAAGEDAGELGFDLDNDGRMIAVPAQMPTAVSVYATARDESLPSYTNHGISGTWVGAPGGDIINPFPLDPACPIPLFGQAAIVGACSSTVLPPFGPCDTGTYVVALDTRFSSALVAGVAALMDGENSGALRPFALKALLALTADDLGAPGIDNQYSRGRINASRAVTAARAIGH